MRTFIMLAVVSVAVFALGIALKANLAHVAIGLVAGGGIGCGLLFVINRLQAASPAAPDDTDQ